MASKRKRLMQARAADFEARLAAQNGPKPFVLALLPSLVVYHLYGQESLFARADEALTYGKRDLEGRNALQVGIQLAQACNDPEIFGMHKMMGGADWANSPVNNVCIVAGAIIRRTYPHRYGLTANLSTVADHDPTDSPGLDTLAERYGMVRRAAVVAA